MMSLHVIMLNCVGAIFGHFFIFLQSAATLAVRMAGAQWFAELQNTS
jgi:hypothetical protein